jgi:acetate kinase
LKILVMNAGSSSQKSCLYEIAEALPALAPVPLWEAHADWTRDENSAELTITTAHGREKRTVAAQSRTQVLDGMLKTLWEGSAKVIAQPSEISIVGHRIVHGGPHYRESVRVTSAVKDEINRLSEIAPLHNPVGLEGIEAVQQLLGDIPQVAVFDTTFHRTIPLEAAIYPGPYVWFEQDIRRYGFHGISHQYCSRRSAQILQCDPASLRLINCHLGNGCSLAAIRNGESIDTTMGFTPLEGLMMGSRSGTVDPSILIYLQREKGYSAEQLQQELNKESGLKGISGISSDLRNVLKARNEGNQRAQLALDIYMYRLRFFIGAMLAALGGLDVLTFTGGVGENSAEVRAAACESFGFLNLKLDPEKNTASPVDQAISTSDSSVRVLVVHTEEDWEIARECWQLGVTTAMT